MGNNEDDIPPCDPERDMVPSNYFPEYARQGLQDDKVCINNITSNYTGTAFGSSAGNVTETQLIHVEGHCHIGCLSMQLWNLSARPTTPTAAPTRSTTRGWVKGSLTCVFGDPA